MLERENNNCFSGPAMGVVAGNKIPNYCIMSDTGRDTAVSFWALTLWLSGNLARVMEKMGEGMRIHISSTSKELLDRVMITFKGTMKNKNIYFSGGWIPMWLPWSSGSWGDISLQHFMILFLFSLDQQRPDGNLLADWAVFRSRIGKFGVELYQILTIKNRSM